MLPPPTSMSSVQRGTMTARLLDGEEDEAALFGFIEKLEVDAGSLFDSIQEDVDVTGFADRTGRNGAYPRDAVTIDDVAEPLQRGDRGFDRSGSNGACRKRVPAEKHAAGGFLDDPNRPVRRDFGNHQADRTGAHIEDGHQLRRRIRFRFLAHRDEGTRRSYRTPAVSGSSALAPHDTPSPGYIDRTTETYARAAPSSPPVRVRLRPAPYFL